MRATNHPRPNILLAISDDQSWLHAGAYGHPSISTPAFDRVAREGVLFQHCYCPAPQCSPSRASLLTGLHIWQLEEAGTHESLFPAKFAVYPDLLEAAGYQVGYTGKPWAPGSWEAGGRSRNPAGAPYDSRVLDPPTTGISRCDYTANFLDFLDTRPNAKPFCFWFGCHEPHRPYEKGSARRAGKDPRRCVVPPFLPDVEVVRNDLLDYELEIEWFDTQLGQMIAILEERGELDRTLVVVASDNGMPFPRAKANLHEGGAHVPLAVRWGDSVIGGRVISDLVTLTDLAPTFLEAAGLEPPTEMTGRSLVKILSADSAEWVDQGRDSVLFGKERHNHARFDNVGYPCRAIRTREHLYVRNFTPDRWPLGDPPYYFCHTKLANPTKEYILAHAQDESVVALFQTIYGKRPAEELYAVDEDPFCLRNLAGDPAYAPVREQLWRRLERVLTEQGDPRVLGYGDIFDSYPHYTLMQDRIGGFKREGEYNPEYWRRAEASAPPGTTLTRNLVG